MSRLSMELVKVDEYDFPHMLRPPGQSPLFQAALSRHSLLYACCASLNKQRIKQHHSLSCGTREIVCRLCNWVKS